MLTKKRLEEELKWAQSVTDPHKREGRLCSIAIKHHPNGCLCKLCTAWREKWGPTDGHVRGCQCTWCVDGYYLYGDEYPPVSKRGKI